MKFLAQKVAEILPVLEERGPVYFFAMIERENERLYDVVLSAEWPGKDWAASVRYVVNLLWPKLNTDERMQIAQVSVIPPSDPGTKDMRDKLSGSLPDDKRMFFASPGGKVLHAFVFKAEPLNASELAASVVGAPAGR